MAWSSAALSMACLVVGLVYVVRMFTGRDVIGEASHAAMGVGMAAMFSPLGNPVPDPVWAAVFVACGAWFAAVALRAGTATGDAGHHVVGNVAMLFMFLGSHSHASGAGSTGHAGNDGGFGLASLVAVGLAGYSAWHVLRCADRFRACAERPAEDTGSQPVALRPPTIVLAAPRTAAAGHLVMGVAMTAMLLGMA